MTWSEAERQDDVSAELGFVDFSGCKLRIVYWNCMLFLKMCSFFLSFTKKSLSAKFSFIFSMANAISCKYRI